MTQEIILDQNYIPFGLAVAAERDRVGTPVHKYGYNGAITTTAETIWAQGADYTWLGAATVLKVTSSDVNDDVAGTGALTVVLEGLDANYAEISETVILTGQVSVNSVNSYLRIHRMYIATAGSGLVNAGVIYAFTGAHTNGVPDVVTTIHSTIAADEGQTLQAFYTVPASYTAYLTNIETSSMDIVNFMTMTLRTRAFGGAWRTKAKFIAFQDAYKREYPYPLVIAEKSDIEFRGIANGGTLAVSSNFDLLLMPN